MRPPVTFSALLPLLKTEIKSITWCDAGSGLSTQTGLVLATLTLGEPNVSIWEQDSAAAKRSKLKRVLQCVGARVLIILGISPVAI